MYASRSALTFLLVLTSSRCPPDTERDGGGRGERDERGEIRVRPDFKGTHTSCGRVKDRAYVIALGARSPTRRGASARLGGRLIFRLLPPLRLLAPPVARSPAPLYLALTLLKCGPATFLSALEDDDNGAPGSVQTEGGYKQGDEVSEVAVVSDDEEAALVRLQHG